MMKSLTDMMRSLIDIVSALTLAALAVAFLIFINCPEIIEEMKAARANRMTKEEREAEEARMAAIIAKSKENEAKKYGNGNGLI